MLDKRGGAGHVHVQDIGGCELARVAGEEAHLRERERQELGAEEAIRRLLGLKQLPPRLVLPREVDPCAEHLRLVEGRLFTGVLHAELGDVLRLLWVERLRERHQPALAMVVVYAFQDVPHVDTIMIDGAVQQVGGAVGGLGAHSSPSSARE